MTDASILYCKNHADLETALRCNNCNEPICSQCAIQTPTGYRCPECVRGQQKIFNTAKSQDFLADLEVELGPPASGECITRYSLTASKPDSVCEIEERRLVEARIEHDIWVARASGHIEQASVVVEIEEWPEDLAFHVIDV